MKRSLLTLLLVGCASEASTNAGTCIAPSNPGGGWDFTCRTTAQMLGTLAPGGRPLLVTNIPGDGGGVAFARMVTESRGNERVIAAASPSTLLGLAQHHYGAKTERDVRWIAALDAEPSVVAVNADAPWRTLNEFVTAWRAHPDRITIGGGSAVGGQDHMKMLLLARTAGMDVRRVQYLPLGGPAEAISLLRAGTVQVYPGDVSKVLREVERGELRVLAVLGEKRTKGALAAVPTAREQGFDLVFVIWRGFYAPPGISDAAYHQWVMRLRTMSTSPEWKSLLARNGLTPFFLGGREFEQFVTEQTAAYRTVSKEIGVIP
jgi:putative tricarboxylic transport membrane protein